MKRISIFAFLIYAFCIGKSLSQSVSKIAFGSCAHEEKPQPILDTIVKEKPDLFIYLGDNIYGDTKNMKKLQKKYDKLGAKPEFQRLKQTSNVIATWDDHDYGIDDGGAEYPMKAESKEVFLNFWGEPQDSERRTREGIYTSYYFGEGEKRLQVILLDNRTFKTPWVKGKVFEDEGYIPNYHIEATMLGEAQWQWLRDELKKPAALRIITTSTQFVPQFNGYELWAYMPREKMKMQQLIYDTKANGVLFISGDTHYAELSKMENEAGGYNLYELTSSGLTQTWKFIAPNEHRIGDGVAENNFGMIDIDWNAKMVRLLIKNIKGETLISHEIAFSELSH
jgi:alkaline phosphatase D